MLNSFHYATWRCLIVFTLLLVSYTLATPVRYDIHHTDRRSLRTTDFLPTNAAHSSSPSPSFRLSMGRDRSSPRILTFKGSDREILRAFPINASSRYGMQMQVEGGEPIDMHVDQQQLISFEVQGSEFQWSWNERQAWFECNRSPKNDTEEKILVARLVPSRRRAGYFSMNDQIPLSVQAMLLFTGYQQRKLIP